MLRTYKPVPDWRAPKTTHGHDHPPYITKTAKSAHLRKEKFDLYKTTRKSVHNGRQRDPLSAVSQSVGTLGLRAVCAPRLPGLDRTRKKEHVPRRFREPRHRSQYRSSLPVAWRGTTGCVGHWEVIGQLRQARGIVDGSP
jgi:hypothetical protein